MFGVTRCVLEKTNKSDLRDIRQQGAEGMLSLIRKLDDATFSRLNTHTKFDEHCQCRTIYGSLVLKNFIPQKNTHMERWPMKKESNCMCS